MVKSEQSKLNSKIITLVSKGYTQGAFKYLKNANFFADLWKKKGHKIEKLLSSGEVIEGGYKKHAYYIIAVKK